MFVLLRKLFEVVVRTGDLTVEDCTGHRFHFGDGNGPAVGIRLADRSLERQLALDPELAAGEGYMQGRLTITEGTVYDFITLMMENLSHAAFPSWATGLSRLRALAKRRLQLNRIETSHSNVRHHYDIDPRIYDLFLDNDRQYSCAYYTKEYSLDTAQLAKKRHIAAKLALEPGLRVLDIGSGWGGFALYLARTACVDVCGVTLSKEQIRISRARAAEQELTHAVRFQCADYRELTGQYDRIVSVGMFEHVGVPQYETYFSTISRLLEDDGVALIHSIGRSDPPGITNPFIAKYIFPGGYIPALSEILAAIEKTGLIVTDVEVLRLHYAETLKAWRERFAANHSEVRRIAGDDFYRMWEFYLAGSEACFRYQKFVVYQIQLTKRVDALPLTRDYMLEEERHLQILEGGTPQRPRLAGE